MLSDSEWPRVMPCSVESQPPAQIAWYKNNRPLEERHVFQVNDGSLYFLSEYSSREFFKRCIIVFLAENETWLSLSVSDVENVIIGLAFELAALCGKLQLSDCLIMVHLK